MSAQPEALRLADALITLFPSREDGEQAAAELRRLHAENELLHKRHHDDNAEYTRVLAQRDALLEALKLAVRQNEHDMVMTGEECRQCRAAIKAVKEEA